MSNKKKTLHSFSELGEALGSVPKAKESVCVHDAGYESTFTDVNPAWKRSSRQLLEYTHFGKIIRCTDRGFGFIEGADGEEWFHVTDKHGKRVGSLKGLEGTNCLFVKGGAPFRYKQSKFNWDRTVVRWQLADELDPDLTVDNFEQRRVEALLAADAATIDSLLLARWYSDLWHRKAGTAPQAVLRPDEPLELALKGILKDADELTEVVNLLLSIIHSPWYAVDPKHAKIVFERFFEPEHWLPHLFQRDVPFDSIPEYQDLERIVGPAFAVHARRLNTVAIDLESDGEVIFQYGWKNSAGIGLRSDRSGLSRQELQSAVEESLNGIGAPIFVGHNLITWDWPILVSQEAPLPGSSHRWDTLIASFLIEPWRESHALIVDENAHRADADAAECHSLFEKQIQQLAPLLAEQFDTVVLVDRLFENPNLLTLVPNRVYPKLDDDAWDGVNLITKRQARLMAWRRDARVEFLTPEFRLEDPVLSPNSCHSIAAKHGGLFAKLISIIVTDAATHDVQIRLYGRV